MNKTARAAFIEYIYGEFALLLATAVQDDPVPAHLLRQIARDLGSSHRRLKRLFANDHEETTALPPALTQLLDDIYPSRAAS